MYYQLFISRKNAADASFKWLPASSFTSCFTKSSLSVVPRQLNWCSKWWSRSLSTFMMRTVSLDRLNGNDAPCDGAVTLCGNAPASPCVPLILVVVALYSVTNFKCHSPHDVRPCMQHNARTSAVTSNVAIIGCWYGRLTFVFPSLLFARCKVSICPQSSLFSHDFISFSSILPSNLNCFVFLCIFVVI